MGPKTNQKMFNDLKSDISLKKKKKKEKTKRMSSIKMELSIDNIQHIHFDKLEKDFSFIVNDKVYMTNSFVANILSHNISKMFEGMIKPKYYQINTKYKGNFNKIIKYGEMNTINLREEEKLYFFDIMKQLGNTYNISQLYPELKEDISYDNVIERILIKHETSHKIDEEIEFISKNFHDFHRKHPEKIFTLDLDIIERIISNDKLIVYDEEELFNIILKLYRKSRKYSILFSYVIFTNLSIQCMKNFSQYFDINDMNKFIWSKIIDRLEQNISKDSDETTTHISQKIYNNRYITYQILVKTLTGKPLYLRVTATNHIKDIKKQIYDNEGILPEKQLLQFANCELEDEETLQHYGITNNSSLHLFLRPNKQLYQIFINTPAGKHIIIPVESTSLIKDVKTMIQDKEGIPPKLQLLTYLGKPLHDEETLQFYGITNDSTLHLLLKVNV